VTRVGSRVVGLGAPAVEGKPLSVDQLVGGGQRGDRPRALPILYCVSSYYRVRVAVAVVVAGEIVILAALVLDVWFCTTN
jgi:hypothetical protein